MPTTFQLPDYPVHVYGEKENRKRISPGGKEVYVIDGDETKELKSPLVVDHAVRVYGDGNVTVEETEDKPPRPKRPSEKKKAAAKPKAPAKKKGQKK